MTKEETKQVLTIIRASFPNFFKNMPSKDMSDMMLVWCDIFIEDNAMVVITAVKSYIRSNVSQFPPSVGQIVELMRKLLNPSAIDADKAWELVYKATCNSIYHANEEFGKLPREVQAGIGSPSQLRSWATMDLQTLDSVVASNFKKGYRSRLEEFREFEKLPVQAKAMIQSLTDVKRIE